MFNSSFVTVFLGAHLHHDGDPDDSLRLVLRLGHVVVKFFVESVYLYLKTKPTKMIYCCYTSGGKTININELPKAKQYERQISGALLIDVGVAFR